ncbi:MAG: ribosome maturation factor RimP [Steroidobacteraceae bacterium]
MADLREVLLPMLEPVVEARGFELVEVEFASGGRGGTLRLYIDSAAGVTVEDCARVSHAVSEALEVQDPIPGHYTLEVSSPGFDRVLRKREHFERFVGERVAVEMRLPLDGRRRFAGTLSAVTQTRIEVEVDGRKYELPLDGIQKARLKPA